MECSDHGLDEHEVAALVNSYICVGQLGVEGYVTRSALDHIHRELLGLNLHLQQCQTGKNLPKPVNIEIIRTVLQLFGILNLLLQLPGLITVQYFPKTFKHKFISGLCTENYWLTLCR